MDPVGLYVVDLRSSGGVLQRVWDPTPPNHLLKPLQNVLNTTTLYVDRIIYR